MEIEEVLKTRKSCRKFSDKKISSDKIHSIVWSGGTAPHASGGPRRQIIPVRKPAMKKAIMGASQNASWVGECDTIFVVCGKRVKDKQLVSGHPRYIFDVSAATMCMDLMAVSLGLATCWIGTFKADKVKEIVKTDNKPTIMLLVGYKGENEKTE